MIPVYASRYSANPNDAILRHTMAGQYTPPKLYDTPVPDMFTLISQMHPQRDMVQVIREHLDAPTDCIRVTWAAFMQHAQNAATDLRARWAQSLKDEGAKKKAAQPREAGESLVVVALLATNGYEYYVNLFGCTLNRWTVRPFIRCGNVTESSPGVTDLPQEQSSRN